MNADPLFRRRSRRAPALRALVPLASLLLSTNAAADGPGARVTGGPDRSDPVSYAIGDPVVWTFRFPGAPPAPAGKAVEWKWTVVGDGPAATGRSPFVPDEPLVVTNVVSAPGFLRAVAALVDAGPGRALRLEGGVAAAASTVGAAIDGIPMPEEPEDFDAFWRNAKAEAQDPTLPGGSLFPSQGTRLPGFRVSAFSIPLGPDRASATGWVSWPAAAAEKSLPLVIRFDDYGIGPSSMPGDFRRDVLFVFVHPHGFPADWDERTRINAFNAVSTGGSGGAYGFRDRENANPETCYFRGMVQRGLAALRFARTLPVWDGKRVETEGRGQGAFQAVACAAVDGGATACRISAPWLCGLGLDTSWQPTFQPALRYFDTVNFARRLRCPVRIEADLQDATHSPSGAARLFKALAGPRTLEFRQGGGDPVATFSAGE